MVGWLELQFSWDNVLVWFRVIYSTVTNSNPSDRVYSRKRMVKVLVTGSAGHLGEALMMTLSAREGFEIVGIDILPSKHTHIVGSIVDPAFVNSVLDGAGFHWVLHAATLHRPHIESHTNQDFVNVNITGTLNLLEAAVKNGVESFVFTSSTSVFGQALTPKSDTEPAVWIDETVVDVPKNIYGVSKKAAEDLCQLFHKLHRLPCVVLRTSRFFFEDDFDDDTLSSDNIKVNEFLNRRAEITDIVNAHILAAQKAPTLGFRRYVISAATPFDKSEAALLRTDPVAVVQKYCPEFVAAFAKKGWKMFPSISRIYDSSLARAELGWRPQYSFNSVVERLEAEGDGAFNSELAKIIGKKGYHRT
jgi:UDP-glucose 4-epimerase